MKDLRSFYRFLVPYAPQTLLFLGVSTVAVAVESIRPYWLKMILEAAGQGDQSGIWRYFLLFGASMIVGNLISALSYYLGDRVLIPFARQIREAVFAKVLQLDFAYHVNKNTGSLISAFKRGDGAIFDLFMNIFQETYRILIYLLVSLYFLARLSPDLAGMLLVMVAINMTLILLLVKHNLKTRTEFNSAEDNVSAVITDSMINYETVKFFAAEDKEEERLAEKFKVWTEKLWGFSNSFRMMDIGIGTSSGTGLMIIMWQAISRLNHGFTIGDLVMVSGFLTSFYFQFFNLFFRVRHIAKNMTDLHKYLGILDNETLVKDPKKEIIPQDRGGEVRFKNVSFTYPKDKASTIDNISLVVEAGKKIAFVGRSGAGKTTLIKLLLRFYDPTAGEILLDGVNIKDMNKATLRRFIGVVPQEPIMFNNTIKFNLAYGKEDATDEEIQMAANQANILDFIEGLADKWETHVGERGIKLSGGQKQRLAIARALLSDPKVLVFDEATSNLDSESEKKIQAALDEVAKKRTVIIIAHRFSTIRDADKIVVLSVGKIAETGKHKQLLDKKGIYAKLWTLQAKGKYNLQS